MPTPLLAVERVSKRYTRGRFRPQVTFSLDADFEFAAPAIVGVMGPNGSGKSTLAHILAGRDGYAVTGGSVSFEGENLLALEPEARAHRGVFLAMQYPVELPGVNNMVFMKTALNAVRAARGPTR